MDPSPTLLVRRADTRQLDRVLPLLLGPGQPLDLSLGRLARLADERGVIVLGDVALPADTPPLAALALDVDRHRRAARIVAIGVVTVMRRRGLGHRLVDGTAVLLRADGLERLDASVPSTGSVAAFLTGVGFVPASQPREGSARQELALWL